MIPQDEWQEDVTVAFDTAGTIVQRRAWTLVSAETQPDGVRVSFSLDYATLNAPNLAETLAEQARLAIMAARSRRSHKPDTIPRGHDYERHDETCEPMECEACGKIRPSCTIHNVRHPAGEVSACAKCRHEE